MWPTDSRRPAFSSRPAPAFESANYFGAEGGGAAGAGAGFAAEAGLSAVLASLDFGVAASADLAGAASPLAGSPLSTRLRFLSLSFLKSVSYQPLPDSRNDGAVSRRRTPVAPQCGHESGSGSLSFCRRSK